MDRIVSRDWLGGSMPRESIYELVVSLKRLSGGSAG